MSKEPKEPMNAAISPAMGDALDGARRANVNASPIAPPNPEVAATARRSQFTSAGRSRILNVADACKVPGQIGTLLRREGIYSSLLATWRKQRSSAQRSALESQKRGPKINPLLAQPHTIMDVQKKFALAGAAHGRKAAPGHSGRGWQRGPDAPAGRSAARSVMASVRQPARRQRPARAARACSPPRRRRCHRKPPRPPARARRLRGSRRPCAARARSPSARS